MIITTTIDTEHQQVVPKVATPEMLDIIDEHAPDEILLPIWLDILAAAPPAPSAWLPIESAPKGAAQNTEAIRIGSSRPFFSCFFEKEKCLLGIGSGFMLRVVVAMKEARLGLTRCLASALSCIMGRQLPG